MIRPTQESYHKVCFGGDHTGIYEATPPELLHVVRITFSLHIIDAFKSREKPKQIYGFHKISGFIQMHGSHQSDRNIYKFLFPEKKEDEIEIGMLIYFLLCFLL